MSKILPCPFCGCENDPVRKNTRVYYGTSGRREEHDYYLNCDGCGLIVGTDKERDSYGDI